MPTPPAMAVPRCPSSHPERRIGSSSSSLLNAAMPVASSAVTSARVVALVRMPSSPMITMIGQCHR